MVGTTLGHYQIEELLGAGGMGVVYRAYDTKLKRTVAIKLLNAVADEAGRARLLREARAASVLNHPNVCTIHEVGESDGQTFIVMEHVAGKSLETLVHGHGLTPETIIQYGIQIADGLAHAHGHGVIHGDLKSANIVITPEGRVKVLDFGLARRVMDDERPDTTRAPTVDDIEPLAGTVAYMAPELLLGQSAAHVGSDIWALGVVLYQASCGQLPFAGQTTFGLTAAILHEPTPPLSARVPAGLKSVVARCLEKKPGVRYGRANDVGAALEAIRAGIRFRLVNPIAIAAAAVLLLVLSGISWQRAVVRRSATTMATSASAITSSKPRRAVAVLGFKNLSGRPESAWISTALAEMLTTELAAGERLRMIPGENIARMKIDLALADSDSYASDTLARIRGHAGTDLVVLGSYVTVGDKIRFDMRLQDATVGETIAVVAETGNDADLLDLVSRMGVRLRERLGVAELSATEADRVRAALPSNRETTRLYAEGLAKLRLFHALEAKDLLEKAVSVDPDLPLAHAALSEAWSTLGFDERAKEHAKKAFDLSGRLSREERLWVEGRFRETANERAAAVEIYKTLFNFFPDNLEYGLQLARAQVLSGTGKDALVTVDSLRRLPAPVAEDPRIDLAEAAAAGALSDLKRRQAAAARAVMKGKAQGAGLLVAGALLSEAAAWQDLGDPARTIAASDEARRSYSAAGDRGGEARALRNIAVVHRGRGNLDEAKRIYEQALASSREIGDRRNVALTLNNIANVVRQQGGLDDAQKLYDQSLAILREIGDRGGVANVLNNSAIAFRQRGDLVQAKERYREALAIRQTIGEKLGQAQTLNNIANVLYDEGDLVGARKMYEESLVISKEIADKRDMANALFNIAGVLRLQGDLPGAKSLYEQALAVARESQDRSGAAWALHSIATVLTDQGDLAEARKGYEEALKIQEEIGEKGRAADVRLSLAGLAIEEGRPADVDPLVRRANEVYRAQKASDDEASGYVMLARALLAQGKPTDAQRVVDRALALLVKSRNRHAALNAAITSARARAANGHRADATRRLDDVHAEAVKVGFLEVQFQARLASAEVELTSGKAALGRSHLEALEKETALKGFHLIARKAANSLTTAAAQR